MKSFAKFAVILQFLACFVFVQSSRALSMNELRSMPQLTPEEFGHLFANFEFKFHAEVQNHDVFLKSRSGDCDDYATVAAAILGERGYTPRMIAIRMKGETHVVCYIQELGGYLDYNVRKEANPVVPCSSSIVEIAAKVARSFGRDWVATYEFTYQEREDTKRLVDNIIPNPYLASNVETANAGSTRAATTAQAGAKPAGAK